MNIKNKVLYNIAILISTIFYMTIENAWGFFAFDVATYLLIALVLTFVIVLVDKLFFATDVEQTSKKPVNKWLYFILFLKFEKNQKYAHRPKIVQWSAEFFPVLLLVFFIRGFIAEPFRIPSNSMMPTLLTGDFVLVNKFAYGLRMPLTNQKLLETTIPERGEVVVFRYPNYEKNATYKGADFIKRIIGLPGDKITYVGDELTVNGEKITYKTVGSYEGFKSGIKMSGYNHKVETIGENSYDILTHPSLDSRSVELVVPDGHYFVMGDNRNNSSDSRFWGFVPDEYLIGEAVFVWMYFDSGFDFTRIGVIK
jgi:signal peptidase I